MIPIPNNYFISDLHFGHDNILKFDDRPFKDTDEMEHTIIVNWNSTVTKQDTTYILGDFCWNKDEKEWIRLLDMLNGNKVLIVGNHDLRNPSNLLKRQFADIKYYKEITCDGKHVIMCHYPILFYKNSSDINSVILHGHVHALTNEAKQLEACKQLICDSRKEAWDNRCQIYNVGCMMPYMNYTPRRLGEIINARQT